MTKPVRIALLALPESTASTLYGMYDLFKGAGRDWDFLTQGQPGPELIDVTIISARPGPFTTANGITITPHTQLKNAPAVDVICVPDIFVVPGESLENRFNAEKDYLRCAYAQGTTIATACSGALLLAETGLLDGWQATTHWGYCEFMRNNYPRITVLGQRSLVVSGEGQRLIMAGGGTTWLDLTLLLIARFCGVEHAMGVARVNLIDWHTIGQQPFAHLAPMPKSDDAVARSGSPITMRWRHPWRRWRSAVGCLNARSNGASMPRPACRLSNMFTPYDSKKPNICSNGKPVLLKPSPTMWDTKMRDFSAVYFAVMWG